MAGCVEGVGEAVRAATLNERKAAAEEGEEGYEVEWPSPSHISSTNLSFPLLFGTILIDQTKPVEVDRCSVYH